MTREHPGCLGCAVGHALCPAHRAGVVTHACPLCHGTGRTKQGYPQVSGACQACGGVGVMDRHRASGGGPAFDPVEARPLAQLWSDDGERG